MVTYIPTAEHLGLIWLPLILRAAGLVVNPANRQEVIAELAAMDEKAPRVLRRSKVKHVLGVNVKIRQTILEKMTEDDVSVEID